MAMAQRSGSIALSGGSIALSGSAIMKSGSMLKKSLNLGKPAAQRFLDPVAKFAEEINSSIADLVGLVDAYCTTKGVIRTCDAVLAASGSGYGEFRSRYRCRTERHPSPTASTILSPRIQREFMLPYLTW